MSRSIELLPDVIATQLRSSITITTLADVVDGLIKNSLAARATRIEITLDLTRGNCVVKDNGTGLDIEHLTTGSSAHLLSTGSPDRDDYAYNATFLGALSALSLLTITSQRKRSRGPNSATWYRGKLIASRDQDLERDGHLFAPQGTCVSVHDLFGNMPVRVKHRSFALPYQNQREWHDIKQRVLTLAIAWPWPVSLKLHDAGHSQRTLYLPGHAILESPLDTKAPPPALDINRIFSILSRAGSVPLDAKSTFIQTSAQSPSISIHGFISTQPVSHKHAQYIMLDSQPLRQQGNGAELYDIINQIFERSSFGALDEQMPKPKNAVSWTSRKQVSIERNTCKGPDRWPMFILNIAALQRSSRATQNSRAQYLLPSRYHLEEVLKTLMYSWLNLHCHRTRHRRREESKRSGRTTIADATTDPVSERPFIPTHARANRTDSLNPVNVCRGSVSMEQCFSSWSRVKSSDFKNRFNQRDLMSGRPSSAGITVEKLTSSEALDKTPRPATSDHAVEKSRSRPTSNTTDRPIESEKTTWFAGFFRNWQNPQFEIYSEPRRDVDALMDNCDKECSTDCHNPWPYTRESVVNLSKANLARAQVTVQIDRKYIFIKLPVDHETSLVLVDQHAASERCILEELLSDLCASRPDSSHTLQAQNIAGPQSSISTIMLATPLRVELARDEVNLLISRVQYFADWGILYEIADAEDSWDEANVLVTFIALPNVIAERCMNEPRLLIDLVREELHADGSDRRSATQQPRAEKHLGNDGPDKSWLKRIDSCPKRLLDMIKSRACRSAIMFNDVLTNAQCQELIDKLSRCAFPFMCAHGRVSMVPLINLPQDSQSRPREGRKGRVGNRTFISSFDDWKAEDIV